MRGIAGFLIAAVVLAALGGVLLRASHIEGEIADARQHVATLKYKRRRGRVSIAPNDTWTTAAGFLA